MNKPAERFSNLSRFIPARISQYEKLLENIDHYVSIGFGGTKLSNEEIYDDAYIMRCLQLREESINIKRYLEDNKLSEKFDWFRDIKEFADTGIRNSLAHPITMEVSNDALYIDNSKAEGLKIQFQKLFNDKSFAGQNVIKSFKGFIDAFDNLNNLVENFGKETFSETNINDALNYQFVKAADYIIKLLPFRSSFSDNYPKFAENLNSINEIRQNLAHNYYSYVNDGKLDSGEDVTKKLESLYFFKSSYSRHINENGFLKDSLYNSVDSNKNSKLEDALLKIADHYAKVILATEDENRNDGQTLKKFSFNVNLSNSSIVKFHEIMLMNLNSIYKLSKTGEISEDQAINIADKCNLLLDLTIGKQEDFLSKITTKTFGKYKPNLDGEVIKKIAHKFTGDIEDEIALGIFKESFRIDTSGSSLNRYKISEKDETRINNLSKKYLNDIFFGAAEEYSRLKSYLDNDSIPEFIKARLENSIDDIVYNPRMAREKIADEIADEISKRYHFIDEVFDNKNKQLFSPTNGYLVSTIHKGEYFLDELVNFNSAYGHLKSNINNPEEIEKILDFVPLNKFYDFIEEKIKKLQIEQRNDEVESLENVQELIFERQIKLSQNLESLVKSAKVQALSEQDKATAESITKELPAILENITEQQFDKKEIGRRFGKILQDYINNGEYESTKPLYPNQKDVLQKTADYYSEGKTKGYYKLPPGNGKTAIASAAIRANYLSDKPLKTIFLVPTRVLLKQGFDEISNFIPEAANNNDIGLYYSDKKDLDKPITVMTYQSLVRGLLTGKINPLEYGFVVEDEGHETLTNLRKWATSQFSNAVHLFTTATPRYNDEKSLKEICDGEEPIVSKNIIQSAIDGDTSSFKNILIRTDIKDFASVQITSSGEYNKKSLEKVFLKDQGSTLAAIDIYENFYDEKLNRSIFGEQGVIFTTGIEHAKLVVEEFNKKLSEKVKKEIGDDVIPCAAIHSKMGKSEIDEILYKYKQGKILLLANVDMLTRGFDDKLVDKETGKTIRAGYTTVELNIDPTLSIVEREQKARNGRNEFEDPELMAKHGIKRTVQRTPEEKVAYNFDVIPKIVRGDNIEAHNIGKKYPVLFAEVAGGSEWISPKIMKLVHFNKTQNNRTNSKQTLDYDVIYNSQEILAIIDEFSYKSYPPKLDTYETSSRGLSKKHTKLFTGTLTSQIFNNYDGLSENTLSQYYNNKGEVIDSAGNVIKDLDKFPVHKLTLIINGKDVAIELKVGVDIGLCKTEYGNITSYIKIYKKDENGNQVLDENSPLIKSIVAEVKQFSKLDNSELYKTSSEELYNNHSELITKTLAKQIFNIDEGLSENTLSQYYNNKGEVIDSAGNVIKDLDKFPVHKLTLKINGKDVAIELKVGEDIGICKVGNNITTSYIKIYKKDENGNQVLDENSPLIKSIVAEVKQFSKLDNSELYETSSHYLHKNNPGVFNHVLANLIFASNNGLSENTLSQYYNNKGEVIDSAGNVVKDLDKFPVHKLTLKINDKDVAIELKVGMDTGLCKSSNNIITSYIKIYKKDENGNKVLDENSPLIKSIMAEVKQFSKLDNSELYETSSDYLHKNNPGVFKHVLADLIFASNNGLSENTLSQYYNNKGEVIDSAGNVVKDLDKFPVHKLTLKINDKDVAIELKVGMDTGLCKVGNSITTSYIKIYKKDEDGNKVLDENSPLVKSIIAEVKQFSKLDNSKLYETSSEELFNNYSELFTKTLAWKIFSSNDGLSVNTLSKYYNNNAEIVDSAGNVIKDLDKFPVHKLTLKINGKDVTIELKVGVDTGLCKSSKNQPTSYIKIYKKDENGNKVLDENHPLVKAVMNEVKQFSKLDNSELYETSTEELSKKQSELFTKILAKQIFNSNDGLSVNTLSKYYNNNAEIVDSAGNVIKDLDKFPVHKLTLKINGKDVTIKLKVGVDTGLCKSSKNQLTSYIEIYKKDENGNQVLDENHPLVKAVMIEVKQFSKLDNSELYETSYTELYRNHSELFTKTLARQIFNENEALSINILSKYYNNRGKIIDRDGNLITDSDRLPTHKLTLKINGKDVTIELKVGEDTGLCKTKHNITTSYIKIYKKDENGNQVLDENSPIIKAVIEAKKDKATSKVKKESKQQSQVTLDINPQSEKVAEVKPDFTTSAENLLPPQPSNKPEFSPYTYFKDLIGGDAIKIIGDLNREFQKGATEQTIHGVKIIPQDLKVVTEAGKKTLYIKTEKFEQIAENFKKGISNEPIALKVSDIKNLETSNDLQNEAKQKNVPDILKPIIPVENTVIPVVGNNQKEVALEIPLMPKFIDDKTFKEKLPHYNVNLPEDFPKFSVIRISAVKASDSSVEHYGVKFSKNDFINENGRVLLSGSKALELIAAIKNAQGSKPDLSEIYDGTQVIDNKITKN
jgi:superfamily II DNA or RNA helicase